ncbi:hypothetical protein FB451DRAFT_1176892 [Mycena latifolia]|nr:hypothetical protein FB451DRAFT_1182413 [Mycena latifolia]KAJ7469657.1 hypothetical protein FB451DRAFT_1176892 [Mycena latifolia]
MTTSSMVQIRRLRNRNRRLKLSPGSSAARANAELQLLLTLGPNVYENDGPGDLYFGERMQRAQGKVGETKDVPRRISSYRACRRNGNDFRVRLRFPVQHRIHKEFFSVGAVGGVGAFVQIIREGIQRSGAVFRMFVIQYGSIITLKGRHDITHLSAPPSLVTRRAVYAACYAGEFGRRRSARASYRGTFKRFKPLAAYAERAAERISFGAAFCYIGKTVFTLAAKWLLKVELPAVLSYLTDKGVILYLRKSR